MNLVDNDAVFAERNIAVIPPGIPVCDSATSGVAALGAKMFDETKDVTTIEPADGTPLDCPSALVTGLDGALYVTESIAAKPSYGWPRGSRTRSS